MDVSEAELRELMRAAIARQGGHSSAPPGEPHAAHATHASHLRLPLARGGDSDGACIIEPSVRCTHCGYCLSYGH